MKVSIYTDGSSRGNPGPGGYGIVMLSEKGHRKELAQGFRKTTNNRMELLSVIVALESLNDNATRVDVYSDSKYVVDAVQKGWLQKWVRKKFAGTKNPDLWKRYLQVAATRDVHLHWVKGHAGHEHNERCDELAVQAAQAANLPADEGYEAAQPRSAF